MKPTLMVINGDDTGDPWLDDLVGLNGPYEAWDERFGWLRNLLRLMVVLVMIGLALTMFLLFRVLESDQAAINRNFSLIQQNQRIIDDNRDAIRAQSDGIRCTLLILPADRTDENVAECFGVEPLGVEP